jgi:hypothetical protein
MELLKKRDSLTILKQSFISHKSGESRTGSSTNSAVDLRRRVDTIESNGSILLHQTVVLLVMVN